MPTRVALMTEHLLEVVRGYWNQSALQYIAQLSANVTFDVNAGRCMHLNSVGELETGIAATQMPLFTWQASNAEDVANLGTTASGAFVHEPVNPEGWITCVVATGGFELQSTEFDTARTYLPNQLLTATVANTNSTTGGRLTNAGTGGGGLVRQFVDPVCGVVSKGEFTDVNGSSRLGFWSYFLPAVGS